VHVIATFNMAKSTTRLKNFGISNVFLCLQSITFFTGIFVDSCFVFCTAEAYLDGIFHKNDIFNDVIITIAVFGEKSILKVSFRCF